MNNLSGMIGLARRAGKLRFGTEQTVDAIRSPGKPKLVCLSSDASENTVKKITDGCHYHQVELVVLPISKAELGRCIGKTMEVSVVAIMDVNFRKAIFKQLEVTNASGDMNSAGGAIHDSQQD
ncbi:MAG: L7Ae/L30e/S12e/Gadd45 family ribosomal protein [Eubacteriales bacterium]